MASAKYSRYYTYIAPVTKNPVVKSSAPYIFSIITIAILSVFALKPTIQEIILLRNEVETNRKTLEAVKKKIADINRGKENLEKIDPQIRDKINTLVPIDNPQVTFLISSLQETAPQEASVSALSIETVKLLSPKTLGSEFQLEKIKFSYNSQSDFAGILESVQKLNQTLRAITIQSISINKRSIDDPGTFTVIGDGYFIR